MPVSGTGSWLRNSAMKASSANAPRDGQRLYTVALPTPAREATSSIDIPAKPRSSRMAVAASSMDRSTSALRGRPAPRGGETAPAGAGPGGPAGLLLTGIMSSRSRFYAMIGFRNESYRI